MSTFWHISFIHSTHTYVGSKLYKIHLVTTVCYYRQGRKEEKSSKLQNGRRKDKKTEKFYRLLTTIFVALQLYIQIQKNSFIHSTNAKKLLKSRQC